MGWFAQSVVALVFLTPAWLAIPFFSKNYGVPASVFVVWYFLGCSATVATFGSTATLVPSWGVVAAIFAVGLTAGGVGNNAIFTAVEMAPNPGLPVAIVNGASVTTFLAAIVLGAIMPKYFMEVHFDTQAFIGILLVIVGCAVIAIR